MRGKLFASSKLNVLILIGGQPEFTPPAAA
jgi:hypothetical protein